MKIRMFKNKLKLYLSITSVLLFTSHYSFSQNLYKITWGNLPVGDITIEEFKSQKDLRVPDDLHLDSAIILFQIKGVPGIIEVRYKPGFDSTMFNKYLALLKPGSFVSFENIRLRNDNGSIFQPHNLIFYNIVDVPKKKE